MTTRRVSRPALIVLGWLGLSWAGCGEPILTVDDAAVGASGRCRFVAFLERESAFGLPDGVERRQVRFLMKGREIAAAQTAGEGDAVATCSLAALPEDRFEAVTTVNGRELRAEGQVYAWDDDRTIIAVDIDGTIARPDYDTIFLTSKPEERSTPLVQAKETLTALAAEYRIVYVSGRPRFVLEKSRRWLERHGFPPGPVFHARSFRSSMASKRFKLRELAALREIWPSLRIGIGDREADMTAIQRNGMLAVIVGDAADEIRPPAILAADWTLVAEFFRINRDVLVAPARLQAAVKGGEVVLQPVRLK